MEFNKREGGCEERDGDDTCHAEERSGADVDVNREPCRIIVLADRNPAGKRIPVISHRQRDRVNDAERRDHRAQKEP